MPQEPDERSFGVIPFRVRDGRREYLIVKHRKPGGSGHWGFPKGHAEPDETDQQTARRELAEETGLREVRLVPGLVLEEQYWYRRKKGRAVSKVVRYFVGEVPADAAVSRQEDEVDDTAWGDAEATRDRLTFKEGRRLLKEAEARLGEPSD